MKTQRIGLIGTGALGSAVARRLAKLNLEVRAYNRDARKVNVLAEYGIAACPSPAAAANDAWALVTAVTDSAALEQVLFGDAGALRERSSLLVIDIGTHDPKQLIPIAERAIANGAAFLEAPVTGSVHDAVHGTLNFLAGGCRETVDTAIPFLQMLGKHVYHMGPVGSGNTAKLALNMLVGAMAFGLGEAVALLDGAGLDVSMFLHALSGSGLKSPLYERLGQRYLDRDFSARFSLANLEKDLTWACGRAGELGSSAWLSNRMVALLREASPATKAMDYSVLLTPFIQRAI
jgi:3-hydroxyisobutyrate dehydrogenase-like beta-hydroxyacid dehydrogenase